MRPGELRRPPLWLQVLIGVMIGAAVGATFRERPWLLGWSNADLGPIGLLAVRLLKALATPLIFVAILDAFLKTSLSARSGARLFAICAINVTVAMTVGLVILDLVEPGHRWAGHVEELGLAVGANGAGARPDATLDPLKNLAGFVPASVVEPFAENLVISVVLVAVLAGASLRELRDSGPASLQPALASLGRGLELGHAVLVTMLLKVADLMPFAVALIVADVVGEAGLAVFGVLWIFLATMLAGLLLHALVYYPLLGWLVGRVPPWRYLRAGLDPVITGLSVNSSLATMPVTLRALASLGVRDGPARLSACVGTNFNNDGVMLYEAMATLFLCQAMGLDLSLGEQVTVVLASIMAGVGIAGIPEAGLVILPLVLGAAGLSEAAIAVAIPLIVPVDWIIARVRSGVNVLADMVVAIVLDRFEPDG